jgi:hypothetical protein
LVLWLRYHGWKYEQWYVLGMGYREICFRKKRKEENDDLCHKLFVAEVFQLLCNGEGGLLNC